MKKLRKMFSWILLSAFLQTVVLAYINFIYLPGRGAFRATLYEMDAPAVKNRSFKLPEGADGVAASFDGLYAAYRVGDELEIADIDKKQIINRLKAPGGKITYYRWLPDREMLIYSVKEPNGKSGLVRISTYDIGPGLDRSYPDIKNLPEGSETIDIVLSPLTNVVYPMIKTSKTRARIYKFDIMDNLTLVMKTDLTTIIGETMYSDNLIYQRTGEKIQILDGRTGKTSQAPVKEVVTLIAVDNSDYVYAVSTDGAGSVNSVYYGRCGQKEADWNKAVLKRPSQAEDIFITAAGSIYVADRQRKTVIRPDGTVAAKYQGELLTVIDDYVAAKDGNKLMLTVLEK